IKGEGDSAITFANILLLWTIDVVMSSMILFYFTALVLFCNKFSQLFQPFIETISASVKNNLRILIIMSKKKILKKR
ncbi:hypothetical protein CBG23_09530, partial [Limosilactobacillus reuteri]|uniref:hypothetical protein n=2 Tax=Limosilactobacillus reuteri TaxID=1598 RepID=UPI000BD20104